MQAILRQRVKQKVSHFLLGEEGKVGSRSAFSAAAFIGATSLATVFLGAPKAQAAWCGPNGAWCSVQNGSPWCCLCYDAQAAQGFSNCIQDTYVCKGNGNQGPGVNCWWEG